MGRGAQSEQGLPEPKTVQRFDALLGDCVHVIGDLHEAVAKADRLGRPMRVKLGLDPTAPDIHLGHTVALQKAREFQDAGAIVVLIIGDYTARVGDPTGRDSTRPQLSPEQIDANAITYQEQAFKVLLREQTEVRRNGEWLGSMTPMEMFELLRTTTVAQILERNDFKERYEGNKPISMLEMVYPLLQGLDSVKIDADVELGGTDQLYNLTVGRGFNEQVCLTMPLLVGIDGTERMSKSKGNYVGVSQDPEEMFGRIMRLPDESMPDYWRLVSGHPDREAIISQLADGSLHAGRAKRQLAQTIISRFHSPEQAEQAEATFDEKHVKRETPSDLAEFKVTELNEQGEVFLPRLIQQAFSLASSSEAKRLIRDGAVKLDGEPVTAMSLAPEALRGRTLQAGRRRHVALT